jgi:hypothetical protein
MGLTRFFRFSFSAKPNALSTNVYGAKMKFRKLGGKIRWRKVFVVVRKPAIFSAQRGDWKAGLGMVV